MPFLYGNHVVKAHLGRITEDTPEHQGIVVFSMNDTPLVRLSIAIKVQILWLTVYQGFGVTARSTLDTRKLDPTGIIVFHQACVFSVCIDRLQNCKLTGTSTAMSVNISGTRFVATTVYMQPCSLSGSFARIRYSRHWPARLLTFCGSQWTKSIYCIAMFRHNFVNVNMADCFIHLQRL